MAEKITVPTLGESVTEATVSKWLKNQGEKVVADEPIVELETDKVNVEVPAPSNGVLSNIAVKEGETVNVGSLLGTINGGTSYSSPSLRDGTVITSVYGTGGKGGNSGGMDGSGNGPAATDGDNGTNGGAGGGGGAADANNSKRASGGTGGGGLVVIRFLV